MNERGKSDGPIVPQTPANNVGDGRLDRCHPSSSPAEQVEGRGPAKGNSLRGPKDQTQSWDPLQVALERIRQAASRDKELQLTALWHHVYNVDRLGREYYALKPHAAPGVDGQTWHEYGSDLESNLEDLSDRLKRGAYRARPVKRAWIPKADGRLRPIGIPTLEDKIVQRAAATVLGAVYEVDFLGFSYGFRPGRGAHDALDALSVGITRCKISWVLDADIRGFFDAIDHEWLVKFVEHRIADRRVIRHIKKWLRAGVLEDGRRTLSDRGTPQGGSISPLLANVYLHYVFDLWVHQWRQEQARGGTAPRQDATDRVRPIRGRASQASGSEQTGDVRLPRLHARVQPDAEGGVHGASVSDQQADACEVGGDQGWPAATYASAGSRNGSVAPVSGQRLATVLRRAANVPLAQSVSSPRDVAVVVDASPPWRQTQDDLAPSVPAGSPLATLAAYPASLSQSTSNRYDPRQEPGAVVPHAGICPGGTPQGVSLPGSTGRFVDDRTGGS